MPEEEEVFKRYLHNPAHLFRPNAVYFVTASTCRKVAHIAPEHRRAFLQTELLGLLRYYDWTIIAWVVLPNHYHVLAQANDQSAFKLPQWVSSLHRRCALCWNREDNQPGRRVWWNYWDTCITGPGAFYARLNYIHWNPVKHGLVKAPEQYPYSSYRLYLESDPEMFHRIQMNYPYDRVKVYDAF